MFFFFSSGPSKYYAYDYGVSGLTLFDLVFLSPFVLKNKV
jgi:hypothetical protein